MPKFNTFRRRIGILGAARSGKTVFLTSLINHLKYHDPLLLEGFPVGKRGERHRIRKFNTLPIELPQHEFEYDKHRETIVHQGRWPSKTCDTSLYRCEFERTDWPFTNVELEFLDFPGERVADACIAEYPAHADWSRHMLAILQWRDYSKMAAPFLALMATEQTGEGDILAAYRDLLAQAANHGMASISPSTFLLDTQGNAAPRSEPSDLASTRTSGLPGAEFAPLSAAILQAQPSLAVAFQQRYARYRDEVVMPLYRSLQKCHRLIVLLDIPTILARGTDAYNESKKTMQQLFDVLNPKLSTLGTLGRGLLGCLPRNFLKWHPGGITRAAFVATKGDMIYQEDRPALRNLLHEMTRAAEDRLDRIQFDYFACSAALSTIESPEDNTLAGFTLFDSEGGTLAPEGSMKKFAVSRLPATWPQDWKQGDYYFTDVYPMIPPKIDSPPRQFGLDDILSFIVDERFGV